MGQCGWPLPHGHLAFGTLPSFHLTPGGTCVCSTLPREYRSASRSHFTDEEMEALAWVSLMARKLEKRGQHQSPWLRTASDGQESPGFRPAI